MTMPPGARDPVLDGLLDPLGDVDEREMLIQKVADLEHLMNESDKTFVWANRVRPVIKELMLAYERRIRSLCSTPEELANEPWRCMEYIAAETLLSEQPVWVVTISGLAPSGEVNHE
jgi:hypothetical protein